MLVLTALALWYAWVVIARVLPWSTMSDGGVLVSGSLTLLLLGLLPLAPALAWAAGRRGKSRRVALLFGLVAYAAVLAADLLLLRL